MNNSIAIVNQHYQDINPLICGYEDCAPSHGYGPAVRDYWLLHYVLEGEGVFRIGEKEYHLHASQVFVIRPGELTYYEADRERPWRYIWIGFDSSVAMPQALNGDVLTLPQARPLFEAMIKIGEMTAGKEACLCGKIWELLGILSLEHKKTGQRELYIRQAKNFMETEYMMGITVSTVASRLGLDRSYFSNMFKVNEGKSPQQYLNEIRMRQAATQLVDLGYTVTETAASVGYADVFAFSRMFKQYYGVSPREYCRKINS